MVPIIEINSKTYHFNEIPNTDNKEVLEFLIYLQDLHNICRHLLTGLIQKNKKVKTTIGFVGSIIDRISESIISIMLLSSKGFTIDVAIILLNIIELRTDLKYISKKPEKIEEWFDHEKRRTKPWKFSHQIEKITNNNKEELESEKFVYEVCSIAKHGNPAGNVIGFNLGLKDNSIFMCQYKEYRLTDYLFWTYVYTSDSIKSGLNIVSNFAIKLPEVLDELEEVSKKIDALYNRILSKKVMDHIYQKNPELEKIDKEIERLEKERQKLKAEIEDIENQIRK